MLSLLTPTFAQKTPKMLVLGYVAQRFRHRRKSQEVFLTVNTYIILIGIAICLKQGNQALPFLQ